MMHFIMGADLFNKSLVKYLEESEYINSDLNDALDVFTKIANSVTPKILPHFHVTMKKIAESWLYQKGNPLISVKRNADAKQIDLRQRIFNALELDVDREEDENIYYWAIPLSCTTKKEMKFNEITLSVWLPFNLVTWSLTEDLKKDEWILCNLELNVPGRVFYIDMENWESIKTSFLDPEEYKQISVLTRVRVISDMFALAEGQYLSYRLVFNTMKYLHQERDYAPWNVALRELDRIRSRLLGTSLFERYEKFVQTILEPVFQKQEFKKCLQPTAENDLDSHFEALIMEFSCKFNVKGCKDKSSEFYEMWNRTSKGKNKLKIRRRIFKMVLCEHIKHGDENDWETFWRYYSEEDTHSLLEDISEALACSQEKKNLHKLLRQSIKSDQNISQNASINVLQSLSAHRKGYKLMLKFFKHEYKKIKSLHSEGDPFQLSYLRILLDATNKRRHLNEIVKFTISKKIDMTDKLTSKSMNNARRNIMWAHKNKKGLKNILSDHVSSLNLIDKLKNTFIKK